MTNPNKINKIIIITAIIFAIPCFTYNLGKAYVSFSSFQENKALKQSFMYNDCETSYHHVPQRIQPDGSIISCLEMTKKLAKEFNGIENADSAYKQAEKEQDAIEQAKDQKIFDKNMQSLFENLNKWNDLQRKYEEKYQELCKKNASCLP